MDWKTKYKSQNAYKARCIDTISINPRKADALPARLQAAVDAGLARSKNAYIISAVLAALERDGIMPQEEQQQEDQAPEQ